MGAWNDEQAQRYADTYGEDASVFVVIEAAQIAGGEDVLELGCGSGVALSSLKGVAGRMVGIDPTPSMIELARAACPEGEFRVAPAETTGCESDAFDVVLGINVVEHFDDRAAAFGEAYRVLKMGGRLVIGGELHDPAFLDTPQEYAADLGAAGFVPTERQDRNGIYVQTGRKPHV
ncbi:class I SAM-dependent methyltransferase [Maritimibacter dapengensis]|uniref:Class I SAM-dependent methyltransferase n=1 Tax=Maritimibacter dapengensis TaxID=2836868 RepID=A0ABS6T3H2_9RHOB|nr:class I SAM-dependent methyltransferase [Maritimibacter dapengensis]MBV7379096.1 class I SAM-dependent methyltransferase [Maritimibacter dapengensis]